MMRRAAQVMCRAAMARPAAAPMESMHRNAAAPVSVTPRLNPPARALRKIIPRGGRGFYAGGARRPVFDAPVDT